MPEEPEPPERTAGPRATPEPPADGWRQVRRILTTRPSRGQVVAAVLLAVLGFAVATQVRSTDAADNYLGARQGDLVQLLDSLDATNDQLDQQMVDLRATRTRLQNTSERNKSAAEETRKNADDLAILAGTVGAKGQGITITITDDDETVTGATLLNAIEELRDAGAEAIQINEESRVVAQTYFDDTSSGGVQVDGRELSRPFVIEAIGSASDLADAMTFRGGLKDQVEAVGGSVRVRQSDSIEITALVDPRKPEYAQPTS